MNKQMKILVKIIFFLYVLLFAFKVFEVAQVSVETQATKATQVTMLAQETGTAVIDGEIEISQAYLDYLELTDEEKENVIAPRMYDIPITKKATVTNPFKLMRMLGSSLQTYYSLRDIIPENMVIKNQLATDACWAFASLATLESHLALQDYKNGKDVIIYDFSERHMDYATTREFLNNAINKFGFNRKPGSSAVIGVPISYLTNGLGAVAEEEMEFQGDTSLIDIEEIQNKNVVTQVNDIITFPSYSATDDKTEIMKQMKEHIMNYGAINASINPTSNSAGAVYCNDSIRYPINHAVAIVGWDDEYEVDNFTEGNRPENPGAWIAKNSYGTEVAGDGYLYISYEDVNVYKYLVGIVNAQTEIEYENIYQYDEQGGYLKYRKLDTSKLYLATEFNKKTTGKEYLTQVSINASETYTCKVFVNPDGTSKEIKDLQQVELKAGETETFDAGYHTLEFANPIKIGDNFVVVLEIQGTQPDSVSMLVEVNFGEFYTDPKYENAANHIYDTVTIADGKCFFGTEEEITNNQWTDASKLYEDSDGSLPNLDTTIKAFTTSKVLEGIEITTPPTKISYIEGQDFDVAGMIVTGNWANGDEIDITDYVIQDGTNLALGQTSVTISYNGFTTTQYIDVVKNTVESIEITTSPTTTEYWAGEDFNRAGMVVEATWKDGTTETVTEYTVQDGQNLKNGQTTITVLYEGKTVTQPITVKPNPVIKLDVISNATKLDYVVGQNFNAEGLLIKATYESGIEKELTDSDYTIKDGTNLQENQTTVTIEFEGQTISQPITVVAKEVILIEVKTMPAKTEYIQKQEELDLTGGIIKILYNDETEEEMLMLSNEITASGFNNEVLGIQTINLTYQGKTAQFNIEVKELAKPENSNFDNAQVSVNRVRAYYFTDASKKEYVVLDIEIKNIINVVENEKIEYYYYLSQSPNEENITDWGEIESLEASEIVVGEENKLPFEINSLDIQNFEELVNSRTIYVYVKEIATRNDMKAEKITVAGSLEIENMNIEEYIDGVKKADVNSGTITDSVPGADIDNTLASGTIPNAGKNLLILFCALIIIIISTIAYLRYKDIELK